MSSQPNVNAYLYCANNYVYPVSPFSNGLGSCTVNASSSSSGTPSVFTGISIPDVAAQQSGTSLSTLASYIESHMGDAIESGAPKASIKMKFAAYSGASVFTFTLDFTKGLTDNEGLLKATISSGVNVVLGIGITMAVGTAGLAGLAAFAVGVGLTMLANSLTQLITGGKIDNFGDLVYEGLVTAGATISSLVNDRLIPNIEKVIDGLQALFQAATTLQSPLVLDLDGDGIETTSLQNGIQFDHNRNGLAEQTAWVGSDDGILVLDRNQDGRINDGSEVFGDNTVLSNSQVAAQGFAALADLDTNADGKIDANDTEFANLRVLKGDGTLHTLAELDIASLNLSYSSINTTDANGNVIKYQGSYTKTDTSTGTMSDVYFVSNPTYRIDIDPVEVSSTVAALPDAKGYGNVYDLHQAMMRDTSGDLQDLVEDFMAATSMEAREALLDDILYLWTDAANQPQNNFGNNSIPFIDAMKLAVLEQFMGRSYDGNFSAQLIINQGTTLFGAYHILKESIYAQLASQTSVTDYIEAIQTSFDELTGEVSYDLDPVIDLIDAEITTDAVAGKAILAEVTRVIKGLNIVSDANYQDYYDTFAAYGEEYQQILDQAGLIHFNGTASGDALDGLNLTLWTADTAAQNEIASVFETIGGAQDGTNIGVAEVINGGAGNDTIRGYAGDDFLDGGADHDSILGGTGNDFIKGGSGQDSLYGEAGNDTLIGGTANDYLNGGAGNDVYRFNLGDGSDTIQEASNQGSGDILELGAGITANDIYFTSDGITNDLYIKFLSSSDQIRITGQLSSTIIETLRFADTSELTAAQMLAQMQVLGTSGNDNLSGSNYAESLYGGAGNDQLSAKDGNDSLYGGTGNDMLRGGAGDDKYYFTSGDGQDTIYEGVSSGVDGGADELIFTDLLQSDVTFSANGDSLVASINGGSDKVSIYQALNSTAIGSHVETIRFSDNSTLTLSQIISSLETLGTSGNDNINGSSGNDVIRGLAGNDNINGQNGNDNLYGGDGNDIIQGGNGNDFISGDAGIDTLYGNADHDTLAGGAGNDNLYGSTGDDTYLFNIGDGRDTLYENASEGTDTLVLGAGISREDIYFRVGTGSNLEVAFANQANDAVVISNQLGSTRVESIVLADNTVIDYTEMTTLLEKRGTESNENLQGSSYSEWIRGYGGNDSLYGYDGNDTLDGGLGNDSMTGGTGNDTYMVDSASDTVVESASSGTDTVIASISYTLGSNVENLTLSGTGNINATGNSLDNALKGNSGNNSLAGGAGNDTYQFGTGIGQDTLSDSAGTDKVAFDSSVSLSSVVFFQNGSGDLQIGYTGSSGDLITVQGQNVSGTKVERFELSNGQYMTDAEVNQILSDMASYATTNSISLTSLDDVKNDAGLVAIVNGGWHS